MHSPALPTGLVFQLGRLLSHLWASSMLFPLSKCTSHLLLTTTCPSSLCLDIISFWKPSLEHHPTPTPCSWVSHSLTQVPTAGATLKSPWTVSMWIHIYLSHWVVSSLRIGTEADSPSCVPGALTGPGPEEALGNVGQMTKMSSLHPLPF